MSPASSDDYTSSRISLNPISPCFFGLVLHGYDHGIDCGFRSGRDLGRPATIQADVTVNGSLSADHLQALIEVARARQAEPIDLGEREVSYVTPRRLGDQ
jgi:hypothetical protein